MDKLKKLRASLKSKHDEMQALMAKEGDFTAEDSTKLDEMTAECEAIEGQIKALEKANSLITSAKDSTGVVFASIKTVEDKTLEAKGGFDNLAEFATSVKKAQRGDSEAKQKIAKSYEILGAPSNFHKELNSDEGMMVPPEFRNEIKSLMFDEGFMSRFTIEPTASNSVKQLFDDSTPWGSTGVQANWAGEGTQFTASELATKEERVELHKLYAYVLATDELLEDAPRLNDRLTKGAARAIDWKAGEALVSGNGVGKPLGFSVAGCLVEQAKEGSQTADTINAQNVSKMYGRLLGNKSRAFWMVHPDAYNQLITMTLGNQPIFTAPSEGIKRSPDGALLGLPVVISDYCETLGDKGDLYLVNPEGYFAVQKSGGIKFAQSMHLYFDYDMEAFRWTFRMGGRPYLNAAVSPAKGSATRSHFVTLAARA